MMTLKKLRDTIKTIADVGEAYGKKKDAADVRSLGAVLSGDDSSVALEAINDLHSLLAQEVELVRNDYMVRLLDAATDEPQFHAIYAELSKDRRIKKIDVDAIAHGYIGGRDRWPSKKSGLEAISKKFVERAFQASKMKIVEKTKVW